MSSKVQLATNVEFHVAEVARWKLKSMCVSRLSTSLQIFLMAFRRKIECAEPFLMMSLKFMLVKSKSLPSITIVNACWVI